MWIDPDDIPEISDHQREAVGEFCDSSVGLLTGGPGTGKSWTLTHLLTAYHGDAYVAAPTGKAASRINEIMPGLGARTIHATLEPGRNGRDGSGWGFMRNEFNPLACDLLIVDETSMVDGRLMASALRAVNRGTRLLFVGDPFQLPPVGSGKPFLDMIDAGLPHGRLTEIHRFAGRIAKVCDAIKKGERWWPSPQLDLDAESPENLRHYEVASPIQQVSTLKTVIEKLRDNRGYDPIRDVQVICPVNEKSPVSRANLNRVLQGMLNEHGERIEETGKSGSKNPYRVGDKVMCLENRTCNHWVKLPNGKWEEQDGPGFYCANGDMGIVTAINLNWMIVEFSGKQTRWIRPDFGTITLAYAVTGHKMQGSQSPVVITIADDYSGANYVAGRSWWYTALSRASEISIVIGKRSTIERHCRNVDIVKRKTYLKELLAGVGEHFRRRKAARTATAKRSAIHEPVGSA